MNFSVRELLDDKVLDFYDPTWIDPPDVTLNFNDYVIDKITKDITKKDKVKYNDSIKFELDKFK